MIYFLSDYSQGAHPKILEALEKTNYNHSEGYGLDEYSENAKNIIKNWIKKEDTNIHFMVGGTPSNIITIASALKPYEGVISPKTGHIYSHETGAIEATGHRIISMETAGGKLTPELIDKAWEEYEDEHTVIPKLVYLSQPTEIGTLYSKEELEKISNKCKEKDMYLYVDGARLGTALTADDNDLTIQELANLVDAFYIGGTKNGALFGEALVINNEDINHNFRYMMKRQGGLFAKGRLLGVQFETLLDGEDNSIFIIMARHANEMAKLLQSELEKLGIEFYSKSQTNQIFPILPTKIVDSLKDKVGFYNWAPEKDGMVPIRLVTSWSTPKEDIEKFVSILKDLLDNTN